MPRLRASRRFNAAICGPTGSVSDASTYNASGRRIVSRCHRRAKVSSSAGFAGKVSADRLWGCTPNSAATCPAISRLLAACGPVNWTAGRRPAAAARRSSPTISSATARCDGGSVCSRPFMGVSSASKRSSRVFSPFR